MGVSVSVSTSYELEGWKRVGWRVPSGSRPVWVGWMWGVTDRYMTMGSSPMART